MLLSDIKFAPLYSYFGSLGETSVTESTILYAILDVSNAYKAIIFIPLNWSKEWVILSHNVVLDLEIN